MIKDTEPVSKYTGSYNIECIDYHRSDYLFRTIIKTEPLEDAVDNVYLRSNRISACSL